MHSLHSLIVWITLAWATRASPIVRRDLEDTGPDWRPDCTTYSFSYPLWRIYDPIWMQINRTSGGTVGDFWFTAHNMATDVQIECEVKNTDLFSKYSGNLESPWFKCKDNATQFRVNVDLNTFELKQDWVCDNSPNIKFVGQKKTDLPVQLGCLDTSDERGPIMMCFLANVNIEPLLVSPVEIEPTVPWLPYESYFTPATCVERSETPTWTVEDLYYDHTMLRTDPNWPESHHGLSFNLTNLSNTERVSCSVRVDETTLDRTLSERWVDCSAPESSDILSTAVLFNEDYSLLAINQTWQCGGSPAAGERKIFAGVGYLEQPLKCTSDASQRSSVDDLSSLSYSCTMPTTNLTGYYDYIPRLPHTYYTRSCTMNSLNVTALTLSHYKIETATGTTEPHKVASFAIFNPGSGEEYSIRRMPVQDDGMWHTCAAGEDALPWQLVTCQYQLSGKDEFGFRFQWYCDDRDPEHAVLFSATASGRLDSGSTSVELDLSALSWKTTTGPMDRGPPLPWV